MESEANMSLSITSTGFYERWKTTQLIRMYLKERSKGASGSVPETKSGAGSLTKTHRGGKSASATEVSEEGMTIQ